MHSTIKKRHFWILVSLGLLIRVAWILAVGNEPLEGDALLYAQAGFTYLDSDYQPYWPPGLPVYLAIWGELFGFGSMAMRCSMLPWWLALALLLLPLLKGKGEWAGFFVLAWLSVYPTFVLHGAEPLSHLPAGVGLTAAFLAAVRWREDRRASWLWVLMGSMVFLTLLRPSAVLLLVAIPAYLWWGSRRWVTCIPLFAGLIVVGLVVLGTSLRHGRLILVNDANPRNLYLGNNPWTDDYKTWYLGSHWTQHPELADDFRQEIAAIEKLPEEQKGAIFFQKAMAYILEDPGKFAQRSLSRVRTFWVFDTMAGARRWHLGEWRTAFVLILGDSLLFCGLGLLVMLSLFLAGPEPYRDRLQAWIILAYAVPYFISFSHPTYHLAILPLLALVGGRGLEELMRSPRGAAIHKIGRRTWWVLASLIFLLLQVEWVYHMSKGI